MKILMFSGDPKVVEGGSSAAERMKKYGEVLEKLDIILLSSEKEGRFKVSEKVNVYALRGGLLRLIKGIFAAQKLCKKEQYDLITAQEIEHSFLAWRLSRKNKIPFQMQIHTDIFSPYFKRGSFKNKVRVWLAKFLIKRASSIRVVSERIRKSLFKLQTINYKLPTIVVLPIYSEVRLNVKPLMFDIKKKYPGYNVYLLMVARLTTEKNIGLALEALREVVKNNPTILLVIVGDGLLREKLGRDAKIGLEDNVIFEGSVPNNALPGYYRSSDALLITSNYEGYGLVAVEAIQNGLPVIMTDVGVAGEIVKNGENGIIVSVGDVKALQNAILKISDNAFREVLARGAKSTPMPYRSFEEYREKLLNSWKTCALE